MGIPRVVCPSCGAGLKSTAPAGFAAGEAVECPKCGTYFAAEPPAAAKPTPAKPAVAKAAPAKPKKPVVVAADDDDEDDRPRPKKKRRRDDDDDRPTGYRNSPLRYVILGVLVVVMLVMAYFLYLKLEREKQDARGGEPRASWLS